MQDCDAYQMTTCDVMRCQKRTVGRSDSDVHINGTLSDQTTY